MTKSLDDELNIVGPDLMKNKILSLLEGTRHVLCSEKNLSHGQKSNSQGNNRSVGNDSGLEVANDDNLNNFKQLLIEDMKSWTHQAFINYKVQSNTLFQM